MLCKSSLTPGLLPATQQCAFSTLPPYFLFFRSFWGLVGPYVLELSPAVNKNTLTNRRDACGRREAPLMWLGHNTWCAEPSCGGWDGRRWETCGEGRRFTASHSVQGAPRAPVLPGSLPLRLRDKQLFQAFPWLVGGYDSPGAPLCLQTPHFHKDTEVNHSGLVEPTAQVGLWEDKWRL